MKILKSIWKAVSPDLSARLRESGLAGARGRLAGRADALKTVFRYLKTLYTRNTGEAMLAQAMESDFAVVLAEWGILEPEADRVASLLRREAALFGLLSVWAFGYLAQSAWTADFGMAFWAVALAAFPSVTGLTAARLWRAECLERRRFVPFRRWLALGW
jgi:hypothetical protein